MDNKNREILKTLEGLIVKQGSIERLSAKLGVSEKTVRRWLSGESAPREKHMKTISALDANQDAQENCEGRCGECEFFTQEYKGVGVCALLAISKSMPGPIEDKAVQFAYTEIAGAEKSGVQKLSLLVGRRFGCVHFTPKISGEDFEAEDLENFVLDGDHETLQVLIVEDFKETWLREISRMENNTIAQTEETYNEDGSLDALAGRIAGRKTTLFFIENAEGVGGPDRDAFEIQDRNFVIPRSCYIPYGAVVKELLAQKKAENTGKIN